MKGFTLSGGAGPHAAMPLVLGGAALTGSAGVALVLHGRGGRASDLMDVARQVVGPDRVLLGPEAFHGTWYPQRFTAPIAANEPSLSSAISMLEDLVERLVAHGVPAGRIVLLGFSQGACLALEYASRRAGVLGAVVAFSGGLMGDTLDRTRYRRKDGTAIFIACAERDPHIPLARVQRSATLLRCLGATVRLRLHRGDDHAIHSTDIGDAAQMVSTQDGLYRRAG